MKASRENMEKILKFREKKMKELKRNISFSEALSLWFSEAGKKDKSNRKAATV